MGGPAVIDGKTVHEVDNFYDVQFEVKGKKFSSSECYFQCMKTTNEADFEKVRNAGSGEECWEAGTKIALRQDWEHIKVQMMYEANLHKFQQNKELREVLIATKGDIVYGTGFWDKWNGIIMTRIRAELRDGPGDLDVVLGERKKMEEYRGNH